MSTNFVRRTPGLGFPGTARTIAITTAAAQLVSLTSGHQAMVVANLGPNNVAWGDSSLAAGSGVVLFPNSTQEWLGIQDGFGAYWRADSTATTISVQEYEV